MEPERLVESLSGVLLPEGVAESLEPALRIAREAAAGLPFGAEPLDFLSTLERLAADEEA